MKEQSEKKYWFVINVMMCLIILMVFIFIILFNGMIDDHKCWIDGYQTEHCQKYIRGNE